MKFETIKEATQEWVNGFNAIPQGVIEKLMKNDFDEVTEITPPSMYDRVSIFGDEWAGQSGEIIETKYDGEDDGLVADGQLVGRCFFGVVEDEIVHLLFFVVIPFINHFQIPVQLVGCGMIEHPVQIFMDILFLHRNNVFNVDGFDVVPEIDGHNKNPLKVIWNPKLTLHDYNIIVKRKYERI